MIGPVRLLLGMWLGILVSLLPSGAQSSDQTVPNVVSVDVLALLAPVAGTSRVLWSAVSNNMISLGVALPALPADGDRLAELAQTLRNALWSRAIGAVSIRPTIGGVTLGARLQIAGNPVATLWTLRARSNTIDVLLLLPQEGLASLPTPHATGAKPARSDAPRPALPAVAPPGKRICALLSNLSARIASGEKPRLTQYFYRTNGGAEFTTLEAGEPAMTDPTTRVVDSQGFFQFADARRALAKILTSSKCQ